MHLQALTYADPLFAAGAGSFSSGLETLADDGLVATPQELASVVRQVLTQRWNTFDRVCLARSWEADERQLLAIDALMEVSTIGAGARRASKRAGLAMLGVWTRLDEESPAAAYRRQVRAGRTPGHLTVAQAVVYRTHHLALDTAESLSCGALLSGLVSSAVRLGIVGHRAAQLIYLDSVALMGPLLAEPIDPGQELIAWTPLQDIALERHQRVSARLFAS